MSRATHPASSVGAGKSAKKRPRITVAPKPKWESSQVNMSDLLQRLKELVEPRATAAAALPPEALRSLPYESSAAGPQRPRAVGPASIATTGRYVVLFRQDGMAAGIDMLKDRAGMKVARSGDFGGRSIMTAEGGLHADAVTIDELGVAVLDAPPDQMRAFAGVAGVAAASPVLTYRPERILFPAVVARGSAGAAVMPSTAQPSVTAGAAAAMLAMGSGALSEEYLRGFRDALNQFLGGGGGGAPPLGGATAAPLPAAVSEALATWGLQLTNALHSRYSGKGIKIAVLDTGLDLQHADFFPGRNITHESFVDNEAVQDVHGHGTHCIGSAAGPRQPTASPRAHPASYGVAYGADIFAGKVLSNAGRGNEGDIIDAIRWAVRNGCQIVSMSLETPVPPGTPHDDVFEDLARRAMARGTLIVAASGNGSRRPMDVAPVSHPANCPSVIAVGALDAQLAIAPFSNGGTPNPEDVDIYGPGVDVYSSYPGGYQRLDGTSMATPHVAGIAALWAEANPGISATDLRTLLLTRSKILPGLPAGLAQAP